jgi:flagellar basal-body rod modification protein FlgD
VSNSISGITTNGPANTQAGEGTQNRRMTDALGRDAFLQLLTTQLAHQDPLQPQGDTEFIAQLAQFSSLEQLTQMKGTLDLIAAALLLPQGSGGA